MDHHGSVPLSQCPIVSTQAIVGLPLTRSTSGSLVAPPRVVSTPPQLEAEEEAGLRLSETPTVGTYGYESKTLVPKRYPK